LSVPETAPSGTGLAGMETSVMGSGESREWKEGVTPYSNLSAVMGGLVPGIPGFSGRCRKCVAGGSKAASGNRSGNFGGST
jgi:hypothetical protein